MRHDLRLAAVAFVSAATLLGCLPDSTQAPHPPGVVLAPDLSAAAPGEENLLAIDGGELSGSQLFHLLVLPLISPTCRGCHGGRAGDLGPPFMASNNPDAYDPYQTMKNWRNFATDIAEQSLLVTRGPHEGPALDLDQSAAVIRWLRQEKVERDLQTKPATRPQTKPFTPVTDGTTLNVVDLGKMDAKLVGAKLQFTAKVIPNIRGISLKDLRLINLLPGAMMGDQRTIRIARPILVVWSSGVPQPDVGDSLGSFDRSVKLNEDDKAAPLGPGGPGVQIAPLLTLPTFDVGDALSFAFNIATTVGAVLSPNTCRTAGYQLVVANPGIKQYLGAAGGCTQSKCHDTTTAQTGINMDPLKNFTGTDYTTISDLCEQLKYYRNLGILLNNTNPTVPMGNVHPYRWGGYPAANPTKNGCTDNGFPSTCFNTFKGFLDAWTTADP